MREHRQAPRNGLTGMASPNDEKLCAWESISALERDIECRHRRIGKSTRGARMEPQAIQDTRSSTAGSIRERSHESP